MRRRALVLGVGVVAAVAVGLLSSVAQVRIEDGGIPAEFTIEAPSPIRRVVHYSVSPRMDPSEWKGAVAEAMGSFRTATRGPDGRYRVTVWNSVRVRHLTNEVLRYSQLGVMLVVELENGERWLFIPALPDLRTQRELTLRIPADGRLLQGGFAKLPLTRDE